MAAHGTLWLVQTNLGAASDIGDAVRAIRATGQACRELSLPPMSDDLPDLRHDGPVVCYGSTRFVTAAARSGQWRPGVWFDEEAFSYGVWAGAYGALLLNDPAECERTTIGAFAASVRPEGDLVFLRPERDLKEFSGHVLSCGEAKAWCETIARGLFPLIGPDTPIVIGPPHGIAAEWRLFMVEGRVAAASQYRLAGRPKAIAGAPDAVIAFAASAAARWSPAPVFTLDVCRSGEGLYVVEAQAFDSAGLYACDAERLFEAVGRFAAESYGRAAGLPGG